MENKLEELSAKVAKLQEDMITRKHHEVIVEGISQTLIELKDIKRAIEALKAAQA